MSDPDPPTQVLPDPTSSAAVLRAEDFKQYADSFNAADDDAGAGAIRNANAWSWMRKNIPLWSCPDADLERIYYFRWWTFRKHIVQTPAARVMTEFITPVEHAGVYNTISCALGHHLREGRWLTHQEFLDDYLRFWFRGDAGKPQRHLHQFSGWVATAAYDRALVGGRFDLLIDLLPDFVADFELWQRQRQLPDGLFWQYDVADGMEESISGSRTHKNARPTISSYMHGNALAIAAIADLAAKPDIAATYRRLAQNLKNQIQSQLWDAQARFFKVRFEDSSLSNARELIGLVPWYFNIPDDHDDFGSAWNQITDRQGFWSEFGFTTAERRHPKFMADQTGECVWDGPVWPFAISQTLSALANLIVNNRHHAMTREIFFDALLRYARSHRMNGKPYIGEFQHPDSGQWLTGDHPRSRHYNHSTFCDLVIHDLAGLRPRADDLIEIHPLIPENAWNWFCLDGVHYHGLDLSIVWDKDGSRFGRGAGLSILAGGRLIHRQPTLQPLKIKTAG